MCRWAYSLPASEFSGKILSNFVIKMTHCGVAMKAWKHSSVNKSENVLAQIHPGSFHSKADAAVADILFKWLDFDTLLSNCFLLSIPSLTMQSPVLWICPAI